MAWFIWIIATVFSTFQFSLQTITNILSPDLQTHFHLNAAEVGNLSAAIYWTFLPLQLPIGLLYDYLNTRNILAIGAILCGIGCFMFSATDNIWVAYIGRMIMGIGCGTGYVGMLNIIHIYFSANMFVFLVGLAESISMLLTALLERVSAVSIVTYGWQHTMFLYAALNFFLAAIIFIFIRKNIDQSHDIHEETSAATAILNNFKANIYTIIKNKYAWIACIYGCSMFCILSVITALWGTKFLMDVYGMSLKESAFAIEFIFYGLALGSPIVALYQSRYGHMKLTMLVCAITTVITMLLFLFIYPLYSIFIYIILFFMGALSSGYLLVFQALKDIFPAKIRGLATGFANMIVCVGGIIFQPIIGKILDFLHGPSTRTSTINFYTIGQYQVAFLVIILFIIISSIFVAISKQDQPSETC